ncbi:MAG TPA: branched-chain amino acid ABC transporter permease [Syntrophaceticus sp.]|nr:branched-chain amino acid ABC transporter permease [Syntrophaceticus sp.]
MRRLSLQPGFIVSLMFFGFLAVFPLIISESYVLHVGILCMMYSCYASSWNLVSGFMGIFGLGFQALAGIGGYVSALLSINQGVSPWIGIFIGATCSMIVGAFFSIPSLRLRGTPYIAISSMCLGEVVRLIVANNPEVTRGEMGLSGMPDFPSIGPISFTGGDRTPYWYLIMVFLIIYLTIVNHIVKSPLGRAMNAVRDSQLAASSLGINVAKTKITVYLISSYMMGVIGGFYAHYMQVLTPSSVLAPLTMTLIVAQVLVGGSGTIAGPIIGAFSITTISELLRILGDYRLVTYGLIIILSVLFLPQGVWGTLRKKVLPYFNKKSEKSITT